MTGGRKEENKKKRKREISPFSFIACGMILLFSLSFILSVSSMIFPSIPGILSSGLEEEVLDSGETISRTGVRLKESLIAAGEFFGKIRDEGFPGKMAEDETENKDLPESKDSSEIRGSSGKTDLSEETDPLEGSARYSTGPAYIENDYGVLLDSCMGSLLYLNQHDSHWKDYLIGGEDPIDSYGCGPTALAMIVNSFSKKGRGMTPQDAADFACEHGYYQIGGGSYHKLIPEGLSYFGLITESIEPSEENVREVIKGGRIIVALMGKGRLTANGHFVILLNMKNDDDIMIADPSSFDNSKDIWNLKELLKELRQSDRDGGPLWAVGIPEE